jgi:GxxExxY protein
MTVYNILKPGFLEAVYQEALELEFADREIPFRAQAGLPIAYKGRTLKKLYVADFVVFEKVVVEIKALPRLLGREEAQLLNYLRAARVKVGVLINFGAPDRLEWKRMIY